MGHKPGPCVSKSWPKIDPKKSPCHRRSKQLCGTISRWRGEQTWNIFFFRNGGSWQSLRILKAGENARFWRFLKKAQDFLASKTWPLWFCQGCVLFGSVVCCWFEWSSCKQSWCLFHLNGSTWQVDSNLSVQAICSSKKPTWGVGHGYQPLKWDDHPGPCFVATPRWGGLYTNWSRTVSCSKKSLNIIELEFWYRDWILCAVGFRGLQTKRCVLNKLQIS